MARPETTQPAAHIRLLLMLADLIESDMRDTGNKHIAAEIADLAAEVETESYAE